MSGIAKNIYIVAAKRTPFGNFGGKLKDISATDLCASASKAAIAAAKLDPALIDAVQVGNVAQTSSDAAYVARHVGLKAGVPIETPALTINRLCGSGFQSVIGSVQEILLGEAEIALAGGTESMSQAPLAVYGHQARFGVGLGAGLNLQDTLWSALTDSYAKTPMGITAENLAEKYGITREQCDEFGLRSQTLWAQANAAGHFDAEIAPIEVKAGRNVEQFTTDEGPRQVTLDKLAKLKPVFKKDGVVTAGNASGISDGAGAVILASEDAVKKHNLTPLARVVSYQVSGVEPSIMGIGPVPAIRGALARAGLSINDIDIFDINEAFAAQWLSCVKELGLNPDLVNQCGGAISLGHPLGASGSRITAHLTHALQRTGKKYAVGSACIGGGQGIALVLENAA
uniref:3-ketoacyl-CoA thiolase n=1 Tax=Globisporangium ultimum (strain ATCC 200006 / CBS 805.95 / DAOM BR144) TaxID=431595 RepID=K3X2C1_GLOUD